MQKRRLLAALLAGAMAFSLTACGSSNGDTGDSAAAGGDSYTVGVCQLMQHAALDAATQGFQDKLIELMENDGKSIEFYVQNASGDSATCTTIVNGFVSSGVDLIMGNGTAALQAAQSGTAPPPPPIFPYWARPSPTTQPHWP